MHALHSRPASRIGAGGHGAIRSRRHSLLVGSGRRAGVSPRAAAASAETGSVYINADPYKWPYNGKLTSSNTAFIIIDMQTDFCGEGGYVASMGYGVELTRGPIKPIQSMLEKLRPLGFTIIHTREGHRPDLMDLPANKRWRSKQMGAEIGQPAPCGGKILTRGEVGWDIIPELKPLPGEVIIDKPGKGSFYATDLDLILKTRGIENIILSGVTSDVCVHTTMREANDRGYECLLLSDASAAIYPENHVAALNMVKMQGGIFGCVATTEQFLSDLTAALG